MGLGLDRGSNVSLARSSDLRSTGFLGHDAAWRPLLERVSLSTIMARLPLCDASAKGGIFDCVPAKVNQLSLSQALAPKLAHERPSSQQGSSSNKSRRRADLGFA